ncbi:MAG: hypothetical protein ABSG42_05815 [Nitrospirota bacterium]
MPGNKNGRWFSKGMDGDASIAERQRHKYTTSDTHGISVENRLIG